MTDYLFIDRDGTLIVEPADQQIDSLEKLEFIPGIFSALHDIAASGKYTLVMVSNQDGLGTDSFPEATFHPAQNKLLQALAGEGITFEQILIDPSFPEDNSPNRKPRTGLLQTIIAEGINTDNSWVIGDRVTDVELAANLGCRAILLGDAALLENCPKPIKDACALASTSWQNIRNFLLFPRRHVIVSRKTSETTIEIELDLDGTGQSNIDTGLKFYDHMLTQIARHSGVDLQIKVAGDLEIDEHHTMEDTAILLGEAFSKALGDKRGIERYGFSLPMDDAQARVCLDFGGRPWFIWKATFAREYIGDAPTEMFSHVFKSFSDSARCNLQIEAEGDNEHHKIEAIFKALARAIRAAIRQDEQCLLIPSSKGTI
ncbi:MAG: bifunctional histidinol-phosphatase/imidazoleglycerol-phosphate dehydratase HisB [bacterium]|nr:bifunctional histidinol-phosphatase/imidazoleglycerol-phosphate dehydratase HisB [bacterium]